MHAKGKAVIRLKIDTPSSSKKNFYSTSRDKFRIFASVFYSLNKYGKSKKTRGFC